MGHGSDCDRAAWKMSISWSSNQVVVSASIGEQAGTIGDTMRIATATMQALSLLEPRFVAVDHGHKTSQGVSKARVVLRARRSSLSSAVGTGYDDDNDDDAGKKPPKRPSGGDPWANGDDPWSRSCTSNKDRSANPGKRVRFAPESHRRGADTPSPRVPVASDGDSAAGFSTATRDFYIGEQVSNNGTQTDLN